MEMGVNIKDGKPQKGYAHNEVVLGVVMHESGIGGLTLLVLVDGVAFTFHSRHDGTSDVLL